MTRTAFVWLDLETSSLDPNDGEPLEVSVRITTPWLMPLWAYETLLRPSETTLSRLAPDVRAMHEASGLLAALKQGPTVWPDESDSRVAAQLHHLRKHEGTERFVLAGNSVHFDRSFMRVFMPRTEKLLHHRHLDVSVFKVLADAWTPHLVRKDHGAHRATADVMDAIEQLHYWRATHNLARIGEVPRIAELERAREEAIKLAERYETERQEARADAIEAARLIEASARVQVEAVAGVRSREVEPLRNAIAVACQRLSTAKYQLDGNDSWRALAESVVNDLWPHTGAAARCNRCLEAQVAVMAGWVCEHGGAA